MDGWMGVGRSVQDEKGPNLEMGFLNGAWSFQKFRKLMHRPSNEIQRGFQF